MRSDALVRIEDCESLSFIRLSRNLNFIGHLAFCDCSSLTSIFILPSCTDVGDWSSFSLWKVDHLECSSTHTTWRTSNYWYCFDQRYSIRTDHMAGMLWIQKMSRNGSEYESRWRIQSPSSMLFLQPFLDIIYGIVKQKGLASFKKRNEIGLTPLNYLEALTLDW